jgi:hypothetical protein
MATLPVFCSMKTISTTKITAAVQIPNPRGAGPGAGRPAETTARGRRGKTMLRGCNGRLGWNVSVAVQDGHGNSWGGPVWLAPL